MPGLDFAHVQENVNPHILRMLQGTFSLDTTHMWYHLNDFVGWNKLADIIYYISILFLSDDLV